MPILPGVWKCPSCGFIEKRRKTPAFIPGDIRRLGDSYRQQHCNIQQICDILAVWKSNRKLQAFVSVSKPGGY